MDGSLSIIYKFGGTNKIMVLTKRSAAERKKVLAQRKIEKKRKLKKEFAALRRGETVKDGKFFDPSKFPEKKPSEKKPEKPSIKPTIKPKETIQLTAPEKEERGIISRVFGKLNVFEKLEKEGRLKTGVLPIGISPTAAAGSIKISAEAIGKIRTGLQNKAIVGKLVELGQGTRAVTAARFATNAKTTGLTTSFFVKAGMTLSAAGLAVGIIGSYPFAGFIKEESLQTLSFAVRSARDSGDFELEQRAIDEINDILNPSAWEKILASVPFLNVHTQLKDFYLAAATKNALDQESLNRRREEIGQPTTGEEIQIAAEERRAQDIRDTRFKADYFALIREGKFEEAEELLQEQEATISVSS